jgi:hypothetical protein
VSERCVTHVSVSTEQDLTFYRCAIQLTILAEKETRRTPRNRLPHLKNLTFAKELDTGFSSQRACIEHDAVASQELKSSSTRKRSPQAEQYRPRPDSAQLGHRSPGPSRRFPVLADRRRPDILPSPPAISIPLQKFRQLVALFIRVYRAIIAIGVEYRLYRRQIGGEKVRLWPGTGPLPSKCQCQIYCAVIVMGLSSLAPRDKIPTDTNWHNRNGLLAPAS